MAKAPPPPPKKSKSTTPGVPKVASTMPPKADKEESRPKKTFTAKRYDKKDSGGEKIVIYADSGMGKTTLSSLSPKPIFIAIDDGARKILHPITGERLVHVPGIEDFLDLRDALHSDIYDDYETVVIDTMTWVQPLAEAHILATIRKDKGEVATNMEAYGYGKGYKHLIDHIRMILSDCDAHIRAGRNVILVCQKHAQRIVNSSSEDYLQDGPDLFHSNQHSAREEVIGWSDHLFKIGYNDLKVNKKKAAGGAERVIYTKGRAHFVAKSRTLQQMYDDVDLVSFESPKDGSIWQFMFPEGE